MTKVLFWILMVILGVLLDAAIIALLLYLLFSFDHDAMLKVFVLATVCIGTYKVLKIRKEIKAL